MGLFPGSYCRSAYQVDYEGLTAAGCRGIIFDIDNTLVMDQEEATPAAVALVTVLYGLGLSVCILSNNHRPRVQKFADAVGAQYICEAGKPKKGGYLDAMKVMGTDPSSTVFIGDQIFTDVWGANRAGVFSVLVKKMHPKELAQIVLKRILEAPVVAVWHLGRKLAGKDRAAGGTAPEVRDFQLFLRRSDKPRKDMR